VRTPTNTPACSPRWLAIASLLVFVSAVSADEPPPRKYTNTERLPQVRLAAVHADVQKLQAKRVRIPPLPGLNDYRCILHAHAEDSTHTGGTLTAGGFRGAARRVRARSRSRRHRAAAHQREGRST
jgi:hypothetical protein